MSEVVDERDGDKRGEEVRVNLVSLYATRVQVDGEEADGDVKSFAGNLMPVDEAAPVSVDGDQAQRARGSAEVSPEG